MVSRILDRAGGKNSAQVDDGVRFDIHHVGKAANFIFGKRIARDFGEIDIANVHLPGVLQVFLKIEISGHGSSFSCPFRGLLGVRNRGPLDCSDASCLWPAAADR